MSIRGRRHRASASRPRQQAPALPELRPGRQLHDAQVRRHGPRSGDLAAARAAHGRRHHVESAPARAPRSFDVTLNLRVPGADGARADLAGIAGPRPGRWTTRPCAATSWASSFCRREPADRGGRSGAEALEALRRAVASTTRSHSPSSTRTCRTWTASRWARGSPQTRHCAETRR